MQSYSLKQSFLLVLLAYLVCFLAGYLTLCFLEERFSPLVNMLLADLVATLVIYLFSLGVKNASMYDAYWSVIPMGIVVYWMSLSSNPTSIKNLLLFIAVWYWGIRLTINWCRGWNGLQHQDWRYTMLKEKNPSLYWLTNLGGIHLFPTVMVFLSLIPAYYITESQNTAISSLLIVGFLISIFGTTIEFVADEQMRRFRKAAKPKTYINEGLWKYSRHPNYFGEITFWLGLFVMQLGVLSPFFWWTGIGVFLLTLMFLFISIPMMDNRSLQSRPSYTEQMKRVSALLPLPPKSNFPKS